MTNTSTLMLGRCGLIMGVASERSLAWGIAKTLSQHQATLGFTYQSELLLKRLVPLTETVNTSLIIACDVNDEESIDKAFDSVRETWGRLDFLVHAIAYSEKEQLKGRYLDTTRTNFLQTLDTSCYSLTAVCQRAVPLMSQGGSIVTLSYIGAERVMPHYNVMGVAKAALEASVRYLAVDLGGKNIRVNGISAGPVKTLAASGIGDFRYILKWSEVNSPLHRNITIEDVGDTAFYLLSDLSRSVTGEVLHVDCGYHTVGMISEQAIEEVAKVTQSMMETFTAKTSSS